MGFSLGGGFSRHASFVSRSRSNNLDSDQEALTSGGGVTPVPYSSYLSYGHTGQLYAATSAGSHRGSRASVQLCRCGSGGPLMPSELNSPTALRSPPPCNSLPTSAYSRLVQSLPSTPNASRRPISPMRPSFCHQLPQQHIIDTGQFSSGQVTSLRHLSQPPPAALFSQVGVSGSDCVALGASTTGTTGPPLISSNDSPASFRANSIGQTTAGNNDNTTGRTTPGKGLIQQWTRSQRNRRSSRHKSVGFLNRNKLTNSNGVQPLMKLSTLVIVLLAFLIIGFIVLSPLFHYLMWYCFISLSLFFSSYQCFVTH